MRRTLKDYATKLKRREVKKITDSNRYRSVLCTSFKNLIENNPTSGHIKYDSNGYHTILPINRIAEHTVAFSSFERHSLKLKHVICGNRLPKIRFIKHLGIYVHNSKGNFE